ncbi:transthyretin-like family domain-containing protein [Ditylenchus destructor]|nr:transthyretin-like family domain-containing protein [Ditylenchus destructor]
MSPKCRYFMLFTLLLSIYCPQTDSILGFEQSAGVVGQLLCLGQPAKGVLVKLWDDDSGPDLDDILASGNTDELGWYRLEGSTREWGEIEPKINVYHDCANNRKLCQRKFTKDIPKAYISKGKKPLSIYNMGSIELSVAQPGGE